MNKRPSQSQFMGKANLKFEYLNLACGCVFYFDWAKNSDKKRKEETHYLIIDQSHLGCVLSLTYKWRSEWWMTLSDDSEEKKYLFCPRARTNSLFVYYSCLCIFWRGPKLGKRTWFNNSDFSAGPCSRFQFEPIFVGYFVRDLLRSPIPRHSDRRRPNDDAGLARDRPLNTLWNLTQNIPKPHRRQSSIRSGHKWGAWKKLMSFLPPLARTPLFSWGVETNYTEQETTDSRCYRRLATLSAEFRTQSFTTATKNKGWQKRVVVVYFYACFLPLFEDE